MELNYNVEKRIKINNFLEVEKKLKEIGQFKERLHKEIFHFSKQPVDYSNLRSLDKFRIVSKDQKYIVKFLKPIKKISGVIESKEESFEILDLVNFTELMKNIGVVVFIKEIVDQEVYIYHKEPNLLLKLTNVEGLGSFFEAEFICETEHDQEFARLKVDKVIEELSLKDYKEEEKLYLELLLETKLN